MHTILIIEDDADLLVVLAGMLQGEAYRVLTANEGAQGIRLARDHHPDLVLCDIEMPGMSGYEVLKALQAGPQTADIPLVFLTGRSQPKDIRTGMVLGAEDYLCKPFSPEDLFAALRSRFEKNESQKRREKERLQEWAAQVGNTLAHELRTPLCAMVPIPDLLDGFLQANEIDNAKTFNHYLKESSQRLHKTVDRVVFYNDLVSRNVKGSPERILSGSTPAGVVIGRHAQTVAKRWCRLEDLRLNLAETRLGPPPEHLGWLVDELVENAFKFSDGGTLVSVVLELGSGHWALQVGDAGRGMSEQQVKSIMAFRQFERGVYEQQGLGLGLELVQRLLRLYGGRLQISSAPQGGTKACAWLPLNPAPD